MFELLRCFLSNEASLDIYMRNFIGDIPIINYELPLPEEITGETLSKCIHIIQNTHTHIHRANAPYFHNHELDSYFNTRHADIYQTEDAQE